MKGTTVILFAVLVLFLSGCQGCEGGVKRLTVETAYNFPQGFFWGTATSSHQIEGGNIFNDWWEAEQKGLVPHRSGLACDSYNRYEEDLALAADMRNNAYRFSLEWSRIEPQEGKFNYEALRHYREVIRAAKAWGLEPFITLYHFTLPSWLAQKGGWQNEEAEDYFGRYVGVVARTLGKEANYWITINEPMILASQGYLLGRWPPFKKNDVLGYWACLRHLSSAHNLAYEELHTYNPQAQVGIAADNCAFVPESGFWRWSNKITAAAARYWNNHRFLDKIALDFIGLNYYRCYNISAFRFREENFKQGHNGGEVSWGIYEVVKDVYHRYHKPIFITENGTNAGDEKRAAFIKGHLTHLWQAIQEGVDVRGYFYWSLLDNFEWDSGFTQKFGLVEVDFETFQRTMRPSARVYAEICQANGFESERK